MRLPVPPDNSGRLAQEIAMAPITPMTSMELPLNEAVDPSAAYDDDDAAENSEQSRELEPTTHLQSDPLKEKSNVNNVNRFHQVKQWRHPKQSQTIPQMPFQHTQQQPWSTRNNHLRKVGGFGGGKAPQSLSEKEPVEEESLSETNSEIDENNENMSSIANSANNFAHRQKLFQGKSTSFNQSANNSLNHSSATIGRNKIVAKSPKKGIQKIARHAENNDVSSSQQNKKELILGPMVVEKHGMSFMEQRRAAFNRVKTPSTAPRQQMGRDNDSFDEEQDDLQQPPEEEEAPRSNPWKSKVMSKSPRKPAAGTTAQTPSWMKKREAILVKEEEEVVDETIDEKHHLQQEETKAHNKNPWKSKAMMTKSPRKPAATSTVHPSWMKKSPAFSTQAVNETAEEGNGDPAETSSQGKSTSAVSKNSENGSESNESITKIDIIQSQSPLEIVPMTSPSHLDFASKKKALFNFSSEQKNKHSRNFNHNESKNVGMSFGGKSHFDPQSLHSTGNAVAEYPVEEKEVVGGSQLSNGMDEINENIDLEYESTHASSEDQNSGNVQEDDGDDEESPSHMDFASKKKAFFDLTSQQGWRHNPTPKKDLIKKVAMSQGARSHFEPQLGDLEKSHPQFDDCVPTLREESSDSASSHTPQDEMDGNELHGSQGLDGDRLDLPAVSPQEPRVVITETNLLKPSQMNYKSISPKPLVKRSPIFTRIKDAEQSASVTSKIFLPDGFLKDRKLDTTVIDDDKPDVLDMKPVHPRVDVTETNLLKPSQKRFERSFSPNPLARSPIFARAAASLQDGFLSKDGKINVTAPTAFPPKFDESFKKSGESESPVSSTNANIFLQDGFHKDSDAASTEAFDPTATSGSFVENAFLQNGLLKDGKVSFTEAVDLATAAGSVDDNIQNKPDEEEIKESTESSSLSSVCENNALKPSQMTFEESPLQQYTQGLTAMAKVAALHEMRTQFEANPDSPLSALNQDFGSEVKDVSKNCQDGFMTNDQVEAGVDVDKKGFVSNFVDAPFQKPSEMESDRTLTSSTAPTGDMTESTMEMDGFGTDIVSTFGQPWGNDLNAAEKQNDVGAMDLFLNAADKPNEVGAMDLFFDAGAFGEEDNTVKNKTDTILDMPTPKGQKIPSEWTVGDSQHKDFGNESNFFANDKAGLDSTLEESQPSLKEDSRDFIAEDAHLPLDDIGIEALLSIKSSSSEETTVDEEFAAKMSAFEESLPPELKLTYSEIKAKQDARIKRLEKKNETKTKEIELLKKDLIAQHQQIQDLMNQCISSQNSSKKYSDMIDSRIKEISDMQDTNDEALNQEISDLRVQLEACEAAVIYLEWQKKRKGNKNLKKGVKKLNKKLLKLHKGPSMRYGRV